MDGIEQLLLKFLLIAPPILLALTIHELSHGLVAYMLGDNTAKMAGRLSLNPLRHLDPAGTMVFFFTAWLGAGIGWAKPVPINLRNTKNPKNALIWTSAAGPLSNLIMAWGMAMLFNLCIHLNLFAPDMSGQRLLWQLYIPQMLVYGVQINVIFAMFNLLPVPPLDGSGVLTGLLPPRLAYKYQQLGRYGMFIIMGLIFLPSMLPGFPDIISMLVRGPASALMRLFLPQIYF